MRQRGRGEGEREGKERGGEKERSWCNFMVRRCILAYFTRAVPILPIKYF